MRYLFMLTILCGILLILGCSCDETSKSRPECQDKKMPAEPADKDGWLVSTNPDGLELKVKAEKTGKESFKIHYVLTNKGSKPIYRVVANDVFGTGKLPEYFVLIRPFDIAYGEKRDGALIDPRYSYAQVLADNVKPEELVILFGMDILINAKLEQWEDWAHYKELSTGKSISGTVDMAFPMEKTSCFGIYDSGHGEDEINSMAKSVSGVPCVVAFGYADQPNKALYLGGKLIESKRLMLKTD